MLLLIGSCLSLNKERKKNKIKIKFSPKVNNSNNVDALSFFSSLLFTHSPRLRTNVFLIFSSSVASQACGRGEAGMADKSGIVSPNKPSRAVTWRRWATAKNQFIKTSYDDAKWFSILWRKISSTYYDLGYFNFSYRPLRLSTEVFVVCRGSQRRRGQTFNNTCIFLVCFFVCLVFLFFAFFSCCSLVCLFFSR